MHSHPHSGTVAGEERVGAPGIHSPSEYPRLIVGLSLCVCVEGEQCHIKGRLVTNKQTHDSNNNNKGKDYI